MFRWPVLILLTLLVFHAGYGQDTIPPSLSLKWDNGFHLKSSDDNFSLKFGGRIMVDHAHFFGDAELDKNFGKLENSSRTEITSARIEFSGNIYQNIEFKLQTDFSGEKVQFKDLFIGIRNIPAVGNLRIGHFYEPIRLASLTSSKYITFMDRDANTRFSPSRNIGAVIFNDFLEDRLSFQVGMFHNLNNSKKESLYHDGYAMTARITGLPIKEKNQSRLLHLGAAYSFRNPESQEYEISITPGSKLAPKYLQTDIIHNTKNVHLANFEAAFIEGPFSIQSEYLIAAVHTLEEVDYLLNYYAEVSYFLTGETKTFKSSYEGFGRITPRKNFMGREKGLGAWEIAAKYSHTDLQDGIIDGGKQSLLILGVNWYLNPRTRFMINYAHATIHDKGNPNTIQARIQVDF